MNSMRDVIKELVREHGRNEVHDSFFLWEPIIRNCILETITEQFESAGSLDKESRASLWIMYRLLDELERAEDRILSFPEDDSSTTRT